jgi:type IX secretion system PorP/SprF family membrane protein
MLKQVLFIVSVNLLFVGVNYGQQDMLLTHFTTTKMVFNPASTGIEEGVCGALVYRNQWDKVNGAPNSAIFNVEANLDRWFPCGVGISFWHDAIGFNRQNNLMLNYAQHISIPGGDNTLALGIGFGMINMGMSPVWVAPTSAVDNLLPVGFSAKGLDVNFGAYYRGEGGKYFVGFSSTHLNAASLTQTIAATSTFQTYQIARHYYLTGGYKTNPIGPGYIDAQALLRTTFKKTSMDLNARYMYQSIAYGGLGYRTSDAISILLGYMPMANATIGYAYDINTHKLSSISRGSHEIMFKYCYHIPVPPVAVSRHPRWL